MALNPITGAMCYVSMCYDLNVFAPIKFICGNTKAQCDGIRRWGLGSAQVMREPSLMALMLL